MAHSEGLTKSGTPRSPKYFSSIHGSDRPQGVLKTTALAIEVPETQTPKYTVALHKSYPKSRPPPPGLSAYNTHFPTLTPKAKSPSTPQSQRTPKNAFSFSVTNQQKALNGSPRSIITTQSSPNRSIISSQTPKGSSRVEIRSKLPSKSLTPKGAKAVSALLDKPKGALTEVITQISTRSAPPESQSGVDHYQEHLFQTFQALRLIQTFPPIPDSELTSHTVTLQRRKGYEGKKTIIFDLDETLVHCCDEENLSPPDVHLPIVFPTGEQVLAGINIRPFVKECLAAANEDFEVVVFTASHRCYADVVLDYIDPDKKLIHHRLYRDDCLLVQGLHVKDLRIFHGRDLRQVVIVDNAVYSFAYQLDNGIPIITWSSDRQDRELLNLIDYMKILAASDDIRTVNRDTFRLSSFYAEYLREIQGRLRAKHPKLKRGKRS